MAKRRSTYEGSPADIADDKRMAKKRHMTLKEWEASAEDAKRDAAKEAKMRPHHFAHKRPHTG